jgi:subtilisin family serine protease
MRSVRAAVAALLVAALVGPAPTTAAPPSSDPDPAGARTRAGDVIPGRFLVRFRSGLPADDQAAVIRRAEGRAGRSLGLLPDLRAVSADDGPAVLRRLQADPAVRSVEPDRVIVTTATPNDPEFPDQWALSEPDDHDIDAPEAWDLSLGDGVVIAIVDSGIDLDHPDLAANLWTNPGETPGNGIDDDDNGYVDDVHGWDPYAGDALPDDQHGHGTHVAGIAAAVTDNGSGTAGVAPGARLMAIRALGGSGSGSLAAAIEGIDYAWRMGADVANLSWTWGPGVFAPIADAIAQAGANGMLTVTAAGNDGLDGDLTPIGPGGLDDPTILNVAATDDSDALADFSNRGPSTVDIAAPGVGIVSSLLGGGTTLMDGTSMAAPHVAGVAALVLAEHPAWSPAQVRERILETARPVADLAGQVASGGILDARAAVAGADDAPPAVTITAPTAGASVLDATKVVFKGSAIDPEDGSVSATLAWSSSLDGDLGSGPVVTVPGLSVGRHRIRAMATDASGHHVTRTIVLDVGPIQRTIATAPLSRSWSIAVGPDGAPRVAYTRQELGTYVATRSSLGKWSSKLVSPGEFDNDLDVAIAGDGRVSVAVARTWSSITSYADPGIIVASSDGGTWTVDRATFACGSPCTQDDDPRLAFDGDDERYVFLRHADAFQGSGTGLGVVAGRRTSSGALVETLIHRSPTVLGPSLAVDGEGVAHVSWADSDGNDSVFYATDATGEWVTTELSGSTSLIQDTAVAVGDDGIVRVLRSTSAGTQVRILPGGTWTTIQAGPTDDIDAAVDATGRLNVAVGLTDIDGVATGVAIVRATAGGSWATTTMPGGQATRPRLALDGAGHAHLVYHQTAAAGSLRYSTDATGAWAHQTVVGDSVWSAVGYAVDARGVAHAAASRTGTGSGIFVADDASGAWTMVQPVAGLGEWEPRPGLAVSAIGERHLVYGTGPEPDGSPFQDRSVYYATDVSGTWKSVRLGENGGGSSRPLVMDTSGRIHIVFIGGDGGLYYATDRSGAWRTTRVAGPYWRSPALAVSSTGIAHIAAVRQPPAGGSIRTAHLTNETGSWVTTMVSGSAYDLFPSIALDPEGDPNIAYVRDAVGLFLADRRGSTWATRVVTDDLVVNLGSLVIDSDGTRRILLDDTTLDYGVCSIPACAEGPGLTMAVGGPTGSFTLRPVSTDGLDYRPQLVRGRDGSLSAGFSHGWSALRQVRLQPGPTRTATAIVDTSPASVMRATAATLTATLRTATGAPIAGRTLVFKVDGVSIGSATTNASGVATRSWTPGQPAGAHHLTIGFIGGGGYLASRVGPRPLTITD